MQCRDLVVAHFDIFLASKTIHESTRKSFCPFRVISWIVPVQRKKQHENNFVHYPSTRWNWTTTEISSLGSNLRSQISNLRP